MKYSPKTDKEKAFKELLSEVIKSGLKDFYCPILDPSFIDGTTKICYEPKKKPAVGESYKRWEVAAKNFDKLCRIGTRSEYVAFLGVLIKKLVEKGWSVSKAWKAVCIDSKELGHYCDSKESKDDFEDTGSREVCGFYDLANTGKILAFDKDAGGFWCATSWYCYGGKDCPLAYLSLNTESRNYLFYDSVGWLVFECK